jgi:hypothetical protein
MHQSAPRHCIDDLFPNAVTNITYAWEERANAPHSIVKLANAYIQICMGSGKRLMWGHWSTGRGYNPALGPKGRCLEGYFAF